MATSQADVVDYIKNLKLVEVQELIKTLEDELGVTEIACWFNFGDLPHERVVYNMKLFAETVMPEFAT